MDPIVIAVTESNNVYALNATTGAIVWQRNVGTPITSGFRAATLIRLELPERRLLTLPRVRSFSMRKYPAPDNQIFSLNVDTGAINAGWPVDC